jgi:ribosomal protein L7/L12
MRSVACGARRSTSSLDTIHEGAVLDNYTILGALIVIILALNLLWAIDRRSRRTERNIMRLMAHLGASGTEPPLPSDTVKAFAAESGGKNAAIKAYREQTGLGLLEAKEVVEKLSARPNGGV